MIKRIKGLSRSFFSKQFNKKKAFFKHTKKLYQPTVVLVMNKVKYLLN